MIDFICILELAICVSIGYTGDMKDFLGNDLSLDDEVLIRESRINFIRGARYFLSLARFYKECIKNYIEGNIRHVKPAEQPGRKTTNKAGVSSWKMRRTNKGRVSA